MKYLIVLFLNLCYGFFSATDHDAITATFHVIERGHVIMLEVDFDTNDYLSVNTPAHYKITKAEFEDYLNRTTDWEFDDVKVKPKTLSLKQFGHHTKVVCFLSDEAYKTKKIKIKNKFLLGVRTHSNIVMLDLNGVFKDFRLHTARTEITVDYQ